MSLQNQQDVLAKLYTDAEFRRAFLSAPAKIGLASNLTESEIAEIEAIMPEELEFFADSLFWKRLRETEKFTPLTKKVLGDDFAKLFREFSQNYNPQSVKKHYEDALGFCEFLRRQNISGLAKNAAKYEKTKLEFFGFEKRFAVCRLNYDVREISRQDAKTQSENLKKKNKVVVWLRFGKRIKHFFI